VLESVLQKDTGMITYVKEYTTRGLDDYHIKPVIDIKKAPVKGL